MHRPSRTQHHIGPKQRHHKLAMAVMLVAAGWSVAAATAHAQTGKAENTAVAAHSLNVDLPAQPLSRAIDALARQFGVGIGLDAALAQGHTAPALQGSFTLQQALQRTLAGTGLRAVSSGSGVVIVRETAGTTLREVTVTAASATANDLPETYAGGQVARGGRVGLLGNKDFMDTPFSTTSYTEAYVLNRQAPDISSVIGLTDPAIYVSGATGAINDTFSLRGFGLTNSDIAFGGLYGVIPYWRVSPEFAERIEVLKGPSALLNGMPPGGSIGGSINLVPKRASDEPLTRITGTYTGDSQFGIHTDVGRRFGENKQLGIRFNGVYRDGDTAVENQSKKATLASLAIDWRSDRVRLSVDAYKSEDHVDGLNRGISLATGLSVPTPPKADTLMAPSWTYTNTKDNAVILRGEVDVASNVTAYAAYGHSNTEFASLANSAAQVINTQGDFNNNFAYQRLKMDKDSVDTGVRFRFDTGPIRHEAAVTASYYQHDYYLGFQQNLLGTNTWRTNIYNPSWPDSLGVALSNAPLSKTSTQRMSSYGVADTLSFAQDRVQLTVGVRRQNVRTRTIGSIFPPYDASATTPVAALLLKATDNISLYGNYIEGLSAGAIAPAGTDNVGAVFPPYKSKQRELGAKADLGSFATTVSLFQIQKPASMTDPVTNVYSFGGEQRNRGVEWSVFGEAAKGLRVMGGLAYLRPEVTKTQGGANEGKDAQATPRWQAKLGTEWDIPTVPGLTATANLQAMNKQYINAQNTMWVAGRTIYGVGARYATRVADRPVTLRANVANVFNKAYWAGSLGSGLGAPRTFTLSATVDL